MKRWQNFIIEGTPYGSVRYVRATGVTRFVGLALLALLLAVLGLAMLGIFTRVRITMIYNPVWWVGAASVAIGLTVSLSWGASRSQMPTATNPTPGRLGLRQLIPLFLGMSCISVEGILGGLPVLAHHLTSRPGNIVVTVAAKQSSAGRNRCNPRLVISEFTYGLKNYLCPSERAFGQIQVGAKVRVEGNVSDFGVEPRYLWWNVK